MMVTLLIFKNEIDIGNLIDVLSIIANIFIALYITNILQKKLDNSRANKDYLINIISEYRITYDHFIKDLFSDKLNNKEIIQWFKIMTINIETLKENDDQCIYDTLLLEHINLRNIITNSDDFNNQFTNDCIVLSNSLKNKIIPVNKELKRIKHNCIRLINNQ